MTAEGEQQPDAADVANAAAEAVATEGDDRPSDADIIAHAASIRDEQAQRPLVGSREPLSSLMDDFVGAAPALVSKCEALAKSYSHVRRMRRDGNCFFRAFLFGLLERLIGRPEACAAAKKRFGDYGKKLVEAGYQTELGICSTGSNCEDKPLRKMLFATITYACCILQHVTSTLCFPTIWKNVHPYFSKPA